MVTIRLSRGGAKKRPFYNVRVADSRNARDGSYLERVGYFNPGARGDEKRLELNMERIDSWISTGAQPSERVKSLIKDYKLGEEALAEKRSAKIEKRKTDKQAKQEKVKQEALSAAAEAESAETAEAEAAGEE